METGERIKFIRDKTGLTQAAFGEPLGLSQSNVKDIEIGRKKVSIEIALDIERVYHADFKWVLTGIYSQERRGGVKAAPDPVTEKINQHLEQMCEDQRRDVLKYAEEKKQLAEFLKERMLKAG